MKRLPIIDHKGGKYFFDRRLKQIRKTNNPHDFQDLNDFELKHFEGLVKKNGKVKEFEEFVFKECD